ncbi:MAG: glycosyl hydrolase [Saprospirales bacterium]|nr:glycosyl hydrolase [Saprospirales bacterium]
MTSGRIIDIDVNPLDHSEYYAASAHGSLWKTTNGGVTFSPIFDDQNSFAMGAVTIDPSNPHIVWVGTGENNSHSNTVPGDGVYKSADGGKSWTNKGLSKSEQIGAIVVHPENSNIVWVAAYGPHRAAGGDRGVYRTKDGGETWEQVLSISDYTGCWELHMDPRDPDVLYAVAHQRQRHLYTVITGGDESAIYKTTDGGNHWTRLKGGLPQEMVGRIGMAISPVNPDMLYAVVEAKENGGVYKSTDRGASWAKQSGYNTAYPFYMQKLFCDTKDVDRVYAMDILIHVSTDGGKSWNVLGEDKKHVDNHTLWIDPSDNRHLLSGCDGGVYESFDMGKTWDFKANIPIAEVYKVTADNAKPFYNVYIGTQDNNSLGGPSRTLNSGGISNADWYFTWGGDGFETQVDWKDPNIVYAQSQFGGLVRYDKKSGERLYIRPYELDTAYRFDWDAALIVSRHDHKRLYHGGNKVLRSDDMGSTWQEISPDLTRGVPTEILPLMGRSWSIDEMARISSLAQLTTLAESPLDEKILYAGSGDGLIHYTWDGGKTWGLGQAEGVPKEARIHHIIASQHDKMVAYAACQDQNAGNYKPYLLKTTDGGKTWTSINANLPEWGSTYTVGEDHVDPNLLFVGTMFGVFVSNTPEPNWVKLSAGIPKSVSVMDIDLQRDENDLVVSTYGRGVYILDDYSPLRTISPEMLQKEAAIFPIEDGLMFVQADPFGFPGVGFQGASYYTAPNPEVGAVFTYYLKEKPKSLKDQRREAEKELQKAGKDVKHPNYETLRKEREEEDPYLLFTITDEKGQVVRKIKKSLSAGVQRLVWDFRYSPVGPVSLKPFSSDYAWDAAEVGYMVAPGTYKVSLSKYENGAFTQLVDPQSFVCRPLNITSLPPEDQRGLDEFNKKAADMARAVMAADAHRDYLQEQLPYLEKAVLDASGTKPEMLQELAMLKRVESTWRAAEWRPLTASVRRPGTHLPERQGQPVHASAVDHYFWPDCHL